MIVHFITPTSVQKIDAEWIDVATDQGSFVIQEGHAPMLLTMAPGKPLTYELADGIIQTISASRGLVEITRKEVRIIFISE